MKTKVILFLALAIFSLSSKAADLIVDITGVGGAYSSLSAAIAASTAGDRLLIYPNVTPFSENISIPHSLQLLSAVEGERWTMIGDITIPSSVGGGAEVDIVSMKSLGGNILSSGSVTGANAQVRVLGSTLDAGYISFNANNYYLTMADDSLLNGYVQLRKGRVTGNYITAKAQNASCIYTYTSTVVDPEYTYIVGNHLVGTTYTFFNQNPSVINWNCTSNHAYIANNYIEITTTYQHGIYLLNTTSNLTRENFILNNTLNAPNTTNTWAIYLVTLSSNTNVLNNIITGNQAYGLFSTTNNNLNLSCNYNFIESSIAAISNILDDGTNVINDPQTIDTATGELLSGSGINGGNPDAAYTDLDLTRNNVGCYGGSYSRENFNNASTGARTTFMIAPRRVLVGGTIDIEAQGFDY